MALGRSPPQAGAAGGGDPRRPVGPGDPELHASPTPTPAAQVGWAQPHGRGWGNAAVCPPSRRHSGAAPAPHLLLQSIQGIHGVLLYLYPYSRLHSVRDMRSPTRRRQLRVPEPGLCPTPSQPGGLGLSHGNRQLEEVCRFLSVSKGGKPRR